MTRTGSDHKLPKLEHLSQTTQPQWGGGRLEGELAPALTMDTEAESLPDIVTLRPDTVLIMFLLPVALQAAALPYLGYHYGGYRIQDDMLTLRGFRLLSLN